MATDRHVFGKRDFCRHHQSNFNLRTLVQTNIGVEVDPSGTQVLSEALLLLLSVGTADGDGQGDIEALGGAALQVRAVVMVASLADS